MDKDAAEKRAKLLANILENELKEFLQKNPIEKMEAIKEKLIFNDTALRPVIDDLLDGLKKYDSEYTYNSNLDMPKKWQPLEENIWFDLEYFHNAFFQDFLYFSVLQIFLSSSYETLNEEYRKELRSKHNLTPGKLQKALMNTLKDLFLEKVPHGGSEGFWDENRKLEFLALYNRFLIVIKNARRDKRALVNNLRKKRDIYAESKAREEIMTKYEVPEKLESSLYSDQTPKEIALDWAISEMNVNNFNRDYLDKTILRDARNHWKDKGSIIIDISFETGREIYGVHPKDKAKQNKLRFTPLNKPNFQTIPDPNSFLVEATFY